MTLGVLLANIERAGGHVAIVGIVVLLALTGGLVYVVTARRKRSHGDNATDGNPDSSDQSTP